MSDHTARGRRQGDGGPGSGTRDRGSAGVGHVDERALTCPILLSVLFASAALRLAGCEQPLTLSAATQPAAQTQPAARTQPAVQNSTPPEASVPYAFHIAAHTQPAAQTQPASRPDSVPALAVSTPPAEAEPAEPLLLRPVVSWPAATTQPVTPESLGLVFAATQPSFLQAPELAPAPAEPGAAVGQPLVPPGVADAPLRIELPAGLKVEFTMPGKGATPDRGRPVARRQAAMLAAIFVAIYNVTRELGPKTQTERIEGGYVSTDGPYRYGGGLEVRARTAVREGRVTQFDIWLTAPPADGQDRLEVQVRNFTLTSGPLSQAEFDRILRAGGGRLAVLQVGGPDDRGLYSAEVGLVRKPR